MAAPPRKRQQLTKSTWVPTDALESNTTGTPHISLSSTRSFEVQKPYEATLKGDSSRSSSRSSDGSMVKSGIGAAAPALHDRESEGESEMLMLMMVDPCQQELPYGMVAKDTTGYTTAFGSLKQSSPGSNMGSAAGYPQAGFRQSSPESPGSDSDSLLVDGVEGCCSMEVDEGCTEGTEDSLSRMFDEYRQGACFCNSFPGDAHMLGLNAKKCFLAASVALGNFDSMSSSPWVAQLPVVANTVC